MQLASKPFLLEAAPLFEEERDFGMMALFADTLDPICLHLSSARSAFTTDNHPIYPTEIDLTNVFQQWLN